MKIGKIVAEMISTGFYFGKIPFAPGTIGSFLAFPVFAIVMLLANKYGYADRAEDHVKSIYFMFSVTLLLFIAGTYAVFIYQSHTKKQDEGEIIIDEIVGQLLVIEISLLLYPIFFRVEYARAMEAGLGSNFLVLVILFFDFICFRIFDILKPWPINIVDQKMKSALGVMLDDVVAVPFAVLASFALSFMITDLAIYYVSN